MPLAPIYFNSTQFTTHHSPTITSRAERVIKTSCSIKNSHWQPIRANFIVQYARLALPTTTSTSIPESTSFPPQLALQKLLQSERYPSFRCCESIHFSSTRHGHVCFVALTAPSFLILRDLVRARGTFSEVEEGEGMLASATIFFHSF